MRALGEIAFTVVGEMVDQFCGEETPPPSVFRLERHEVLDRTESPIERRMIELLHDVSPCGTPPTYHAAEHLRDVKRFIRRPCRVGAPLLVFPQVRVLKYRLDFLLVYCTRALPPGDPMFKPAVFILECDGLEYHLAKYKQDRERDLELLRVERLPTLRATGPVIWSQPRVVISTLRYLLGHLETEAEKKARRRDHPDAWVDEDDRLPPWPEDYPPCSVPLTLARACHEALFFGGFDDNDAVAFLVGLERCNDPAEALHGRGDESMNSGHPSGG
jgi:hypothetical protein